MVNIPVRKCWHAAKICFLLFLVVCLLSLFEQWRGGKRSAVAQFSNPEEAEYERQIQEDEARIIPGLGEGGVAAHLLGEDKKKGEASEKQLAMNVYLSDRIAYNRTLKDYRNPACQRVVYDAELPSASVIVIFHNEPYSVVVRTLWSVLNSARRSQPWYKQANFKSRDGATMQLGSKGQSQSSPFVYLKEIILVDDNSTLPELKGKLSYYVRTRLPPDMIRILRLPERKGLTHARHSGAKEATGDVMVFLDSHCEVCEDWLRPLLARISEKRTAVLTPFIDIIEKDSFHYYAAVGMFNDIVGGFSFTGHFTWIDVPEREKRRRGSDIAPTWSPTMAGGLFAINRAYYWELGAYDEQMGGWGGENLEMSFRIWQCGGTLETIPCSRVGHVFRSFHPYGLPASSDTHGINTARMAEVWMDEYAELFYLHRPDLRKNPKIGDVTHRKVLREKLQCKPFQWYLDNIYQEKFVPVRDVVAYGRFKNTGQNLCLDTLQRESPGAALGVYPCHEQLANTQHFSLSLAGQLRDEEKCAELEHAGNENEGHRVVMHPCRGGTRGVRNQRWGFSNGRIQHASSGLCLSAGGQAGADVTARACDGERDQTWDIDYNADNDFQRDGDSLSSEQSQRLKQLQRHRRISRSLLSIDENRGDERHERRERASHNNSDHRRSHRKKHKKRTHKKKNKNKFILRIERTVPPPAGQQPLEPVTDHLEVDIRCPHRRLYPNNTFVRDLVSVLNMHDIRVINNGRVFERNRVSQLPRKAKKEKLIKELELIQPPGDQQNPEPAEGVESKPHMKRVSRKRKRPPPPPPHPPPAPAQPPPSPDTQRAVQHKIIIEDFVEMPTTDSAKPKKRYRMRKRNKHKQPHRSDPAAAPPRASAHDAPRDPPHDAPRDNPHDAPRDTPNDTPQDATHDSPPDVPQSARDALLALLGDKIDKATRTGKGKRKRPATAAASAPSDVSDDDGPMALASNDEHDNAGENEKQPGHNDSVIQPLRREMPASASDELTRKQAQDIVQQYHDDSQEEDNEGRQSSMRSKKKPRIQSTDDEAEKKKSSDELNTREELDADNKGKPIKVTMRNNFTFNIGDEFFSWRTNNDDVADILGELAIPSNSSPSAPPIEAWVRPAAAPRAPRTHRPTHQELTDTPDTPDIPELADVTDTRDTLRGGDNNDITLNSDSSGDTMRILTGRGMLDDDDSNSASKSESSGD